MICDNNNFYVYEHWRLDRDECFYVGKGNGNRAYAKNNRNVHWHNIVSKLERIGSGYEIRLVATGLSEKEAFALEKERILFWRNIVDLTNKTDGGEGVSGLEFTETHRKNLSIANSGKTLPEEQKKKISQALKGRKKPEGFAEKLSQKKKGIKPSEQARLKMSLSHKGKRRPLSDETKKKISLANTGKKASEEHKAKLRIARAKYNPALGHRVSDESKKIMSEKRKLYWARKKANIDQ